MSTESQNDIIQTATVAIFSPDMQRVIMIVNRRLWRILPPWGKFDFRKDWDIVDTLLREIGEEIRLALFPGTGIFLDYGGKPTNHISPVFIENFEFIDGSGSAQDSLFFFRLHDELSWRILFGETQWFFLSKVELWQEKMERGGRTYELFLPAEQKSNMKWLITGVMV